jgi:multidrug efflux pump subunit AcrB
MNLIDTSINRPVFAWILMAALVIFGAISLNRLGVSQLPDVDFPILLISADYEGAAPEIIEAEILEPLEERLLAVEGIKEIRSFARLGSGGVILEFELSKNIDVALQEVQAAISRVNLPSGVDSPTIRKQNPEDDPIMFLGVFADKSLLDIIRWVEGSFLDQIRFVRDAIMLLENIIRLGHDHTHASFSFFERRPKARRV